MSFEEGETEFFGDINQQGLLDLDEIRERYDIHCERQLRRGPDDEVDSLSEQGRKQSRQLNIMTQELQKGLNPPPHPRVIPRGILRKIVKICLMTTSHCDWKMRCLLRNTLPRQ